MVDTAETMELVHTVALEVEIPEHVEVAETEPTEGRIVFVRLASDIAAAEVFREIDTSLNGERTFIQGDTTITVQNAFEDFEGEYPCEVTYVVLEEGQGLETVERAAGDIIICIYTNNEMDGNVSLTFYNHSRPPWTQEAHLTIEVAQVEVGEDQQRSPYVGIANKALSVAGRIYRIAYLLPEVCAGKMTIYERLAVIVPQWREELEETVNRLDPWSDPLSSELRDNIRNLVSERIPQWRLELQAVLEVSGIGDEVIDATIRECIELFTNLTTSKQLASYLSGESDVYFYDEFSEIFRFVEAIPESLARVFPASPFGTMPRPNTPAFDRFIGFIARLPRGQRLLDFFYRQLDVENAVSVEDIFRMSFFARHAISREPRYVPISSEVPLMALSQDAFDLVPPEQQEYYRRVDGLGLCIVPSLDELERLNQTVAYCREQGQPVVFYIPTCPADQCILDEATGQIRWKGGEILKGISWPSRGPLEMVAPIAQVLNDAGVDVVFVFATGDMELYSGQGRNMPVERYLETLDFTHRCLADAFIARVYGDGADVAIEGDSVLRRRIVQGRAGLIVDGIAKLAGGKEAWLALKEKLRPACEEFFRDTANAPLFERVIAARSTLYTNRIAYTGEPPTQDRLLKELQSDILDYFTFHTLAYELYGRQLVALTGDSHPLEELAVSMMRQIYGAGYPHIAAKGNYAGSALIVEENGGSEN